MGESSFEHLSAERHTDNWLNYIVEMQTCVADNTPSQLEELLMESHPVLPGEREAYLWLVENLGRQPRVELDESGFHVIPIS